MGINFNSGMINSEDNPHAIFTQGVPQYTQPVPFGTHVQQAQMAVATPQGMQQPMCQMPTHGDDGMTMPVYQQPYQPTPYQYAANVIFKFHVANLTAVEAVDTFISQIRDKLVSKGRAANWFVEINKNSGYTVTCSNGKAVTRGDYWTMDITNISVTDLLEVYPILKEFANVNDLQLNVVESLFGHQVTVNMISSDVQSMISTFTQKVDAEHQSQEPVAGPLDGMTLKNVKTVKRPIKGTDMVEITKTEYEVEMSRNTPSVEEVKQALKP